MTFEQAITRLKNRDEFLEKKIADLVARGDSAFWFLQDREAIAIAISAITFTKEMDEYEKAQSSR